MAFVNLNHYFAERLCQKDQVLRFQQIVEQNKKLLIKDVQQPQPQSNINIAPNVANSTCPEWTQEDALNLLGVTPKKFMSPSYLSHFEMAAYLAHSQLPDLPVLSKKNKKRKVQQINQQDNQGDQEDRKNSKRHKAWEKEKDEESESGDEHEQTQQQRQQVPVIDQDLLCPTTSLLIQKQKQKQKDYKQQQEQPRPSIILQGTFNTHTLGCELEEKGTRFLLGLDRESTVTRPLPNREEEVIPICELRATPVAPDLDSMGDVLLQALTGDSGD